MKVCSSACSVPLLLPSHVMRRGDPYECLKAVQSLLLSETSDPQSNDHLGGRVRKREGVEKGEGGRVARKEGGRENKGEGLTKEWRGSQRNDTRKEKRMTH